MENGDEALKLIGFKDKIRFEMISGIEKAYSPMTKNAYNCITNERNGN
jgi:hypothetical protein